MPYISNPPGSQDRIEEQNDVTISSIGSGEVLKWNGSAWVNNTLVELGVLPIAGPTFTGVLTVGSAVISEADLEQIDDLTAGTAVASKALVVDGNKDIGTIRNLTIDGVFTDGNYTFDTGGNVSGLGTVASGTHTIGTLVVAAASITDTSGALSFGNENLSTTGTLAAGTTTIGTLTVAAASITDSSGTISFGNENLTTTGVVTAGGITLGSAVLIEAELEMLDGITAGTAAASKALVLDASTNITGIGTISAGAITSSGVVTGTAFTAGSAALTEAELELLDGLTAGTAIATKVVTTDGNIDTTGQRNLTISGELDAATGDFSGAVDVAGAFTTSTIVASGIVKTDDATEATTTTDGSLQTDGGLSVVKDAVFGDDVKLLSDSAVLSFGADSDTTLTHTDGTGIGLNGTNKITFNDASQFIQGASNAILALGATDEIDLTATAIDINGNADVSGTFTAGSYHGDTRYIFIRVVGADTDLAAASGTAIGGEFEFPFAGTITAVGSHSDTAGTSSGTGVVDIHLGGSTIMTTHKIDTEVGEQTSREAAQQPVLTTTALVAGSLLTFFVDAIHGTAAKGLTIRLEVKVT